MQVVWRPATHNMGETDDGRQDKRQRGNRVADALAGMAGELEAEDRVHKAAGAGEVGGWHYTAPTGVVLGDPQRHALRAVAAAAVVAASKAKGSGATILAAFKGQVDIAATEEARRRMGDAGLEVMWRDELQRTKCAVREMARDAKGDGALVGKWMKSGTRDKDTADGRCTCCRAGEEDTRWHWRHKCEGAK